MGRLRLNGYGKKIPPQYLRVITSLIPKDIKIDRRLDAGPLSDFTDEERESCSTQHRMLWLKPRTHQRYGGGGERRVIALASAAARLLQAF